MTNWKCGSPACDRPLAWHARRADEILRTEGPDAEREFEMDHPDSEDDEGPSSSACPNCGDESRLACGRCASIGAHGGECDHVIETGCLSDDADECATMRERSVAGVSDEIPVCPIHDRHPSEIYGTIEHEAWLLEMERMEA